MRATVAELRREVDCDFENAAVAEWGQRCLKDNTQAQTNEGVEDMYLATSGFDRNQSVGTAYDSVDSSLLEPSGPMEGLESGGCRVDDKGHTASDLPRKPHSEVADGRVEYIDVVTMPSSSDSVPSQSPTPARRRLARARTSDA